MRNLLNWLITGYWTGCTHNTFTHIAFFFWRGTHQINRKQTHVSSWAEEGAPRKCSSTLINHVSERDDSGPPASSMAAVSLGSWFPALGQRSSSCGPSSPSRSPPDTADVVGPPWRGPEHIWLWLRPDNPALSAPIHFAECCYTHSPQRWSVTHSQLIITGFTGWFMRCLNLHSRVNDLL